jgi:hypothetical protein
VTKWLCLKNYAYIVLQWRIVFGVESKREGKHYICYRRLNMEDKVDWETRIPQTLCCNGSSSSPLRSPCLKKESSKTLRVMEKVRTCCHSFQISYSFESSSRQWQRESEKKNPYHKFKHLYRFGSVWDHNIFDFNGTTTLEKEDNVTQCYCCDIIRTVFGWLKSLTLLLEHSLVAV